MGIKYHYDIIQGGNAWFEARLGMVTASQINTLLTPKGKPAKNAKVLDYAYKIVGERETWRMEDNEFQGWDMERGHIQEGLARQAYNDAYSEVRKCGFIENNNHGFKLGCSPDGLVGEQGGLEIKSRLIKYQIKTVVEDIIPDEYMNQIQCCLLVTGREWWDFVQYSNGLPLYVKRVYPNAETFAAIVAAVAEFEETVKEIRVKWNKNSEKLVKTTFVPDLMSDEIEASEE